jgi:hypothetical protein
MSDGTFMMGMAAGFALGVGWGFIVIAIGLRCRG